MSLSKQIVGLEIMLALFAAAPSFAAVPLRGGDDAALAKLALDVTREEDIRAIKRLQLSYAQYSQFGLWREMSSLFSENGEAIYGDDDIKGRAAIGQYYRDKWGGGRDGLPAGGLHTQLNDVPVINLSADGKTAKGRWYQLSMVGQYGVSASWAEGIMENEYAKENGTWKITRVDYHPVFAGPYDKGWYNAVPGLPIVPYHFTADEAGTPIPPVPADMAIPKIAGTTAAALSAIDRRIQALNDTDLVANLQNAYGYYINSKMWDDAADLFTDDAVLEEADVGIYQGAKSIRRSYDRFGPVGLKYGQVFDHPLFNTIISISPGGNEARSRGVEFRMLGEVKSGTASFGLAVFSNRFVKGKDGKWRIREMRIFPVMATDYYQGWAKNRLVTPPVTGEFAPDKPVPIADAGALTEGAVPAFFLDNPVTGKPVALPTGTKIVGRGRMLPPPKPVPAKSEPQEDFSAAIDDAARRLQISKAYDGVENITHAFANWLDDYQWRQHSQLYAPDGWRGKYFLAFYQGPDHIYRSDMMEFGDPPNPRHNISIHWLTQPVITVASDGKEAMSRNFMLHLTSSDTKPGVFLDGVYPSNEAVLLNGVWKFELVADDEPYFASSDYRDGWARLKPNSPAPGEIKRDSKIPALMQRVKDALPPDHPETDMPLRYHSWLPGDIFTWPNIKPMWFYYKNPVSGRVPPNYCPNMKTCEKDLEAAGYQPQPPPPQ